MSPLTRALAGAFATTALLAGCAETQLGAQAVKEVVRDDSPHQASVQPDARLAPEIFDATGLTIWDGATTLQGVWVAHPLAQRAQRVRVVNTENGLDVEGAMFRRDPTLSGPSILVSSDAARMLALQPGRPTELRLVAIKEGSYASPQTASAAPPPQVETAALPAPEPDPAPEVEAAPEPEVETATATPRFEAAPSPPPQDAPAAAAAPAPEPAAEPEPAPEPRPVARPAPEPEPAPAVAAAPVRGDAVGFVDGELPRGLFVQAGAFGVEINAQALVATLRTQGYPAQYVRRPVGGRDLNVVMVGPLADEPTVTAAIGAAAAAGAPGARKVVR